MFKKLALTTAAAAAASLTLAAPAHADAWFYATSKDTCGGVYFHKDGDTFGFKDFCADGKGVWLEFTDPTAGTPSTSDGKNYKSYATSYNGSYSWTSGDITWSHNMPEGDCFLFRVGLRSDGAYVTGTYGAWQIGCA